MANTVSIETKYCLSEFFFFNQDKTGKVLNKKLLTK